MRLDPSQLHDLKSRTPLSDVLRTCGVDLKGSGPVSWALSPFNAERTPSFKCDDRRGEWYCWSSGRHGDHLDAVMEILGRSFIEAVDLLGGTRPLTDADRHRIEQSRRAADLEDVRTAARGRRLAAETFAAAVPIRGTHGAAYLAARGIVLEPDEGEDLRFYAALAYRGFRDEQDGAGDVLGRYPAMVAAIRDEHGTLIGVHRTYLDPIEPRKLMPPGDQVRNKAKKILGEARGMIRLTPLAPDLVMGEGIETTLSARRLGIGGRDACLAAGVSLGNMAGGAEGRRPHPGFPDQKNRTVPNGVPDHARPGLLPPDEVDSITLLVDGDSEPILTRAFMCVAGRRFKDLERTVALCPAADGMDHNDMLLAALKRNAAA